LALYDKIGKDYDATRKADPFITGCLSSYVQAGLAKKYLDLGCGSGNYTLALGEPGLDITGIDISRSMLRLARLKSSSVNWVQGDLESLPFQDE
jgi:ubiquinone/menaquinone biosynthesis C-methylase UbiE